MGASQSTGGGGDSDQKVMKGMLIAVLILSILNMLIWITLIGIGVALASKIAEKVDDISDDVEDATDSVDDATSSQTT